MGQAYNGKKILVHTPSLSHDELIGTSIHIGPNL